MTINDLNMTEEQIVNEIQSMRLFDKYLQKMLGMEKYNELCLGFARMMTSAELKSFGASDEEIEKACNFADMMAIADEHKADTPQTDCDKCIWNVCNYNKVEWDADTPQTEPMKTADYCDICKQDMCELCIADASNPYCVPSHYEIKQTEPIADTPQTESTGSPIGDYRDGVGAWQTDCDDRYAVRTDSGEVVAYACPLGCEQTDCGWGEPR